MGKIFDSLKTKVKNHIKDRQKMHGDIAMLTDKELHQKAIREGGIYADAWVKRKTMEKELKDRIKNMNKGV